jgi:hypothetical protein
MIENLSNFVIRYKAVLSSQLEVTRNIRTSPIRWSELDFDTDKLLTQLDGVDSVFLYSIIKKAYDYIRAYKRLFTVYHQSRSSYYAFADQDLARDLIIVDRIQAGLEKLYKKVGK